MTLARCNRNDAVGSESTVSFDGVRDFVRLWIQLKEQYVARRGFTVGENTKAIPQTTISDVMQLATRWSHELRRASDRPGFSREREKWQDVLNQIDFVAEQTDAHTVYPHNQRFWDVTSSLAIYLDSTKNVPTRWDLIVESIEESVLGLPNTLSTGAVGIASGAADAAKRAAMGALGLVRELTIPLVLGAAAVAAVFLLSRPHRTE